MDLRFHKDSSIFYDKNGNLEAEPKASLAELERQYDVSCKAYHEFTEKLKEIEKSMKRH